MNSMICGVDEAGRGPVIGPMVIAGVNVEDEESLHSLGLKDSKQLAPSRREYLADRIKKIVSSYEILVVSADDIDDMRRVMTMNELEVYLFSRVVEKLKPDVCYVDAADVNDSRFARNILSNLSFKPRVIARHKADSIYPIVSAASILAKTRRDQEIRRIAKELEDKLGKPLGSGYPADPVTREFLSNWLKTYGDLPPYVRRSWKTVENLLREHHTRKLDI